MSVLVLSEECDPTADVIVESLRQRDVQVHRADLGWFPATMDLDAELGRTGWTGALCTAHRRIDLGDIRSVLYRRPTGFTLSNALSGTELRHARTEAKIGIGGSLWSLPDVQWVNHPARQADMFKPAQLSVAKSVGLTVPATLITNQRAAVHRFAAAVAGPIVVKPLGFASIMESGERRALYTHVLTETDLADLSGVEQTAHLFQRYIADKEYELRLTVVGSGDDGDLFGVAIQAGSAKSKVDFRADATSISYHAVAVPEDVQERARAFMRHFGIEYGAFDFSVDSTGRHWFLECNAAGEYLFVERATGLPITESLADLLHRGAS